jgi:hypothetical protein
MVIDIAGVYLKTCISLESLTSRYTSNGKRQAKKKFRYHAIKSKLICCFKTAMHDYSFDARKKV